MAKKRTRRSYRQLTVAERLDMANTAITNARANPEIHTRMASFGYGLGELTAGQELQADAQEKEDQQKMRYGDLSVASAAHKEKRAELHERAQRDRTLGRIALKDESELFDSMKLSGPLDLSRVGMVADVDQMYKAMQGRPECHAKLARRGLTAAAIQEGLELVAGVREARRAMENADGAAQEATRVRDEALKALDSWMSDFIAIVRIALAEVPQLLEALGIYEPSGPQGRRRSIDNEEADASADADASGDTGDENAPVEAMLAVAAPTTQS